MECRQYQSIQLPVLKEELKMKKVFVLSVILCSFYTVYSQDCFDKVATQAVEIAKHKDLIDSLQQVVKTEKVNNQQIILDCQKISKDLRDTIKTAKSDLIKWEKFKTEKKNIDAQIKQKSDSIALLKNQISDKNKQISAEKQKGEQKSREEKEKGRNEVLTAVITNYNNKKFDDLIRVSTKLSVYRDMQLVGNNEEVKRILSDLEKYFNAGELLARKIDAAQIKNEQIQLNQIKQPSPLLDKLKKNIELYSDFNNELKKTIEKLVDFDEKNKAYDETEIQKKKFQQILSELTDYMYNYYDYDNYPYLSDIVFEIIKRKRPDADADISDLLKKLQ